MPCGKAGPRAASRAPCSPGRHPPPDRRDEAIGQNRARRDRAGRVRARSSPPSGALRPRRWRNRGIATSVRCHSARGSGCSRGLPRASRRTDLRPAAAARRRASATPRSCFFAPPRRDAEIGGDRSEQPVAVLVAADKPEAGQLSFSSSYLRASPVARIVAAAFPASARAAEAAPDRAAGRAGVDRSRRSARRATARTSCDDCSTRREIRPDRAAAMSGGSPGPGNGVRANARDNAR